MEKLIQDVISWGTERDLIKEECMSNQLLKAHEELGEVSSAYLKQDRKALIDGIGDTLVTLIIFAEQNNLNLEYCLWTAWQEIKDRKGKTVNNTFIKANT